MRKPVVIAAFARSPHQPANRGALRRVRPDDLVAAVIRHLIGTSGVAADDIEDLILGCAFPEREQGLNMARMVVLLAGLPQRIGGVTINRFCGSSMQAIHDAVGAIQCDAGDVFVCAGVESMTRIPILGFNPMPNPDLAERLPQAYASMGVTAENLARKYQIPRADQEALTVRSHARAAEAWAAGRFADEVVAVDTKDGPVATDGTVRPDTNAEALATLAPAFDKDGTVTAGTSSPLTDGAAATLVVSEDYAKAHGLPILARVRSVAVSGCAPEIMGIGPLESSRKALQRAGLSLADMDLIELNEAFAAQSLAVARELGARLGEDQYRRRRTGAGSSLGRFGRAHHGQGGQPAEAGGQGIRACDHVHRRRSGDRHGAGGSMSRSDDNGPAAMIDAMQNRNWLSRVAVIGAGVMGSGIAAHIANAGYPVLLVDIVPDGAADRNVLARKAVEAMLRTNPAPLYEPPCSQADHPR